MIEAILLDCGGVVVYPESGEWLVPANLDEILNGRKLSFDREEVRRAFARHAHFMDEGQLITGLGHERALRVEFNRRMNEDLHAGLSPAQIDAVVDYLTYADSKYALYPDAREGVNALCDKYRVGFLSNALPSMVRALDTSGITARLDCFTVSCLCGCQKPGEEIYLRALKELDLPADKCVFVEDLKDNLFTARRLGLHTIRMRREKYLSTPMPDFAWPGREAHTLRDVLRLVDAHNAGEAPLA